MLLIHKGKLNSPRVLLDDALRSTFDQLLRRLFPGWPFDAQIEYPFRHLEVWRLVPDEERAALYAQALSLKGNALSVMRHVACAELDAEVFEALATDFHARLRVLSLLCGTRACGFPPDAASFLLELVQAPSRPPQEQATEAPLARDGGADLTERAIEEYLHRHWSRTALAAEGIRLADPVKDGLPCRQVLTPVNAIDLLGRDATHWWVVELKRGRTDDKVVGQTSRYLGWIERFHSPARGAILAARTSDKLEYAVRAHRGLALWVYGDELELRRAV